MDDRRFDDLAKHLGGSRRRFLKQVIGLGGAATVAALGANGTHAARRGYGGPGSGSAPSGPVNLSMEFRASPGDATCYVVASISNAPRGRDYWVRIWKRTPAEAEHFYSVIYVPMVDGSGIGGSQVTFAPNSAEVQLRLDDGARTEWATVSC